MVKPNTKTDVHKTVESVAARVAGVLNSQVAGTSRGLRVRAGDCDVRFDAFVGGTGVKVSVVVDGDVEEVRCFYPADVLAEHAVGWTTDVVAATRSSAAP